MGTLFLIVAVLVFFCFLVFLFRLWAYNRFQKTMKYGDKCVIYDGEERLRGRITLINEQYVHVVCDFQSMTVYKKDVYPNTIL